MYNDNGELHTMQLEFKASRDRRDALSKHTSLLNKYNIGLLKKKIERGEQK
jgi:hypothetical protein